MEALACRRAVQYAANLGLHSVIFEGDSATIINAVSQGNTLFSSFGNIVDYIRCLVSGFTFLNFLHVHRSGNFVGNFVASALAKKAKNIAGCQVWLAAMPLDIAALIDFDVH